MSKFIEKIATLTRPAPLRWILLLLFALTLPWTILILPIYGANNYTYSQLNSWLTLSVLAIGLNLLVGLTGMISLGHSALFAAGAYVAGYFTSKIVLPFPVAIILAALAAGLLGLVLGLPALRLSGPYLAVATFGFAVAVPELLSSSKELGALFADPDSVTSQIGVFKVPQQTLPGFEVSADLPRYYLFLLITAIMVLLALGLWRGRTGRALRAIRDSETAAQAMGVNIAYYKVLAFVLSSLYAGVAGAMYAAQVGQIDANNVQFSAVEAILFLTAVILGGLGSIWGSLAGAAALTVLPNLISSLNRFIEDTFNYKIENFESIFYGLIIILCIFFMPNGLAGATKSLFARLRGQPPQLAPSEMRSDQNNGIGLEATETEEELPVSDEVIAKARKGV